jgi:hypothetical protein
MKRFNLEKVIYVFLLLSPLLDIMSGLYKELGFLYTPSTFLRPIIPFIILIIIWIYDKKTRLLLSLAIVVYLTYGIVHIINYSNLITGFSYGSIIHEAQYVINYTYLVFLLFIFKYIFYKKESKLSTMTFYTLLIYISSIHLSIITNTSFSSYSSSIGFKGWFYVSGGVGSIVLFSMFILSSHFSKIKIKYEYKILLFSISLFYLTFLIGSRVGLYGSIYFIIVCIIVFLYNYIKNKSLIISKNSYKILFSVATIFIVFGLLFGSYTIKRRNEINNMSNDNNIANELVDIKILIDKDDLEDGYMSLSQKNALINLYNYASEHNFKDTDFRGQQLVYHSYLYLEDTSIINKLFGNGFLTNYGSLTLEMEPLALLYNFGIIGFVLFFGPFIAIFIYTLNKTIKNYKEIDSEILFLFGGVIISYLISLMAGHIYFNTSVMPFVIIMHILLLNKVEEI